MKRIALGSGPATALLLGAFWLSGSALAFALAGPAVATALSAGLGAGLLGGVPAWLHRERTCWREPSLRLSERVTALALDPRAIRPIESALPSLPLLRSIEALADVAGRRAAASMIPTPELTAPPMTRSGLFDAPSGVFSVAGDLSHSGVWSTTEMVNRLHPNDFRWLESSPSEQAFFGWSLPELRDKSFVDVVHEEDVSRVRTQLQSALDRGEVHGVVFRVRTARGRVRAVSMVAATRYGVDHRVHHLRVHLTDVTPKLLAERELRQRTRQLIEVNGRLVESNRQLEELKELYRDLYQNAPAMYFSLDGEGRFIECNDTLLMALGRERRELLGRLYSALLPESQRANFADRFEGFLGKGMIEVESRWVRADGSEIDVWVKGLAYRGPDGRVIHSRSVAQDLTARKRLESELREKNLRLASANEELTRRNREMDEFLHVVSHDLQEPLRTLVAFSDFLMTDYGDRLDADGKSFVTYIVDASRRLRALIQDLTTLSRAGNATNPFRTVNLNEVLGVVRADLAERLRTRQAALEVEPCLPEVWGDRDRIGQLFTNLISNGLKYNQAEHPVVAVSEGPAGQDGWATISIRDNGIGIDPQYHGKIFQLFRRLHTQEEYEGTGAGLAICSKIVNAHGGSIRVESALNEGATFYVTLPRCPGPAAEARGLPVPEAADAR